MNDLEEIIQAICIGLVVATFLNRTGRARKAIELCQESLVLRGKTVQEGKRCIESAAICQAQYRYVEAKELYERAISIMNKTGNSKEEALACQRLGALLYHLGELTKAREFLEKALAMTFKTGDRDREFDGSLYGNLGTVLTYLGDYRKAKEYLEKALAIAVESGDRHGEGACFANLGNVFSFLGDYVNAEEYLEKALAIAIEFGDREVEGSYYLNLGIVFKSRGDNVKAKGYFEKALAIAIEFGDRKREGVCCANLGTVLESLGDYLKAKEYFEKALAIAIEIGDRNVEEAGYANLGVMFQSLGDYLRAKEYLEKALAIAIEIGDRPGKANHQLNLGQLLLHVCLDRKYSDAANCFSDALLIATETGDKRCEAACYHNLADLFRCQGNNVKAKEHYEQALAISVEIGDKKREAAVYFQLGSLFISHDECAKAEEYLEKAVSIAKEARDFQTELFCYKEFAWAKIPQEKQQEAFRYLFESIKKCEDCRSFLKDNDEFKVLYSDAYNSPYRDLSTLYCAVENPMKALYVEELGRARALSDLMAAQYSVERQISGDPQSWTGIENVAHLESDSACLYISYDAQNVLLWILKANGVVEFRRNTVDKKTLATKQALNLDTFLSESFRSFGIQPPRDCEDRSFDGIEPTPDSSEEENLAGLRQRGRHDDLRRNLTLFYKIILAPVADILEGSEIIIVPDRHLYHVPFPALLDDSGKYLSETFRIRIVPSLMTLRCIQNSPANYHSYTGALIVGDPEVPEVLWKGKRQTFQPLPSARKEAEMIGRLLGIQPLIGQQATKQAVVQRINAVSLIHFAAHGNAERGEIALAPVNNDSRLPREPDWLLTVSDISQVQLRAKLVVLSCCHSARGQIKVEGVVGMARAFLGSGARSVLVSLWALDDDATQQFMNHFYLHLARGESASESLHQAMKWMRDNGFAKVSEWAPFLLIGDNVTFDFGDKGKCKHITLDWEKSKRSWETGAKSR